MNSEQFRVIYEGKVREGFQIELVAKDFADKFNISVNKALTILKSDREITLNKQAEHLKAYKLKSTFEEIGMQVKLERILSLVLDDDLEDENEKKSESKNKIEIEKNKPNENEIAAVEVIDANAEIKRASDSWTLDPLQTDEDKKTELENDPDNPNKIGKNDFNYTGLSNSPVIGAKKPK